MSAARQAAEAAFAAPRLHPAPPTQAQVTVRRDRLAAGAAPGAEPAAADNAGPATEPAGKSPRVFRVELARAPQPVETAPAALAPLPARPRPPAAATRNGGPAVVAAAGQPRRIATDRRPGPVLHVVHAARPALPQRAAEQAAPEMHTLVAELARVGQVLQSIGDVQALRFIDDRFADAWNRLSRTADDLHVELTAKLR